MRIETEIEVLTVGSLRALLAQAERAGAGSDAAVSFMRRRGDGGHVARVEFEPSRAPLGPLVMYYDSPDSPGVLVESERG